MNNIIDESGNSINANGAKFSVELFLQCLEKIELDFTPGGTPQFPTLIMHPDMQKLAYEELNRIENNPEIKKKHDAILQRKRSEWIASSLLTKAGIQSFQPFLDPRFRGDDTKIRFVNRLLDNILRKMI